LTAENIRAQQTHDVRSKWKSELKMEKRCNAMKTCHEGRLKGGRKEFLPSEEQCCHKMRWSSIKRNSLTTETLRFQSSKTAL